MKITYLFGAGASRGALPIVNEIPDDLLAFINLMKSEELRFDSEEIFPEQTITQTKLQAQEKFISDLEWLYEESKRHASIDTLAKKLFITAKSKQLLTLKTAFSLYIVLTQFQNRPDNRYDTFFASLIKRSYVELPQNVRIISWNYDNQFEIAFSEYSGSTSPSNNRAILNSHLKYQNTLLQDNRFSIIKLNGSTTIHSRDGYDTYEFCRDQYNCINKDILTQALRNYLLLHNENYGAYIGLSFAWERYRGDNNDVVKKAINGTVDTEILIVIGYSFPYFNREIDREIIGSMTNLKKVYFQAPDAENLRERFLSIRDDIDQSKLLVRKDIGQFLLPNEL